MQRNDWKVQGMTCTNCAVNVTKFLEKKGLQEVKVNPISGDVSFLAPDETDSESIKTGINKLGYKVVRLGNGPSSKTNHQGHHHGHDEEERESLLSTNKKRFFFTLPFTLILMLHMVAKWLPESIHHIIMNPWVQLGVCLPVFLVGMRYFGASAIRSLRNGVPNMDVLIALGAFASFVYSLIGAVLNLGHDYLFFETSASIITLVFFGNYMEESSIQATQKEVNKLAKAQKVMANMIAFDDKHQEQIFEVENSLLKVGDLVLIKTGEQVPADCKILWGECRANEAILTGESEPIYKTKKDMLTGGSVLESGTVKAQVTAAGSDTVLSGIIKMVQDAQAEKPPMQKMADRISAVFVPAVVGIALLTILGNYYIGSHPFGESLMRGIAVLVISCPCAMGLATPAAIAVGLGRGAKSGVMYKNATALEHFKDIKQIVFDKTGTLTTGKFTISGFQSNINTNDFQRLVYSIEKYSIHPLAQPILKEWKNTDTIKWKKIEEVKGLGMIAETSEGDVYKAGSFKILAHLSSDVHHNIYITKNDELIGWVDVQDELRPEAKEIIQYLNKKGIHTILLSGDKKEKAEAIGKQLGIEEVIAEQTPEQKLNKIAALDALAPTAMVGDGVNDAPALSKATLGISLSDASQLAVQSSDVILMNNGLKFLPLALGLGKHTYKTIISNLVWAFLYNIVAIPVAAFGLLSATFAAFVMGFSDLVLAINSLRLFVKKVL